MSIRPAGMNDTDGLAPSPAPHGPPRRALLAILLATYAVPFPEAFATPAHDAFLTVSKLLTGRASLDPGYASRLYDALAADDPKFPGKVQALATLFTQRTIDPLQLQHVLDAEQSPLAALPRKIVTAWYVGIVGEEPHARCIAFETSLMSVVVSDRLTPPSYCYGSYGSWSRKPG